MKKLAIAIALIGIVLMLTEKNGGPWVGTVIGTAMMCAGSVVALRMSRKED